jgi:RNA polymerase sigma-70 factor (ECF subfamily)
MSVPVETADVRYPADLQLAAAALAGDAEALTAVEGLIADIKPALRGVVLDHEIDELAQELRVKLLVGEPPKLAAYAGKGPLRAWLRVALVRAGLDRRRAPRDVQLDETAWLAIPADDPDPALAALRTSIGPAVRGALEQALSQLPSRDRLMLRQHLLDGLSPPDLATLHGVHRVTAFRWLASIKQRVLGDVRAQLARELAIGADSLDSVMRRVRESVAPSVERLLVATPEPR